MNAPSPARARDVAQFMLEQTGRMDALVLEKLCYYVQAWSLAWDDRPAFADPIEAWKYGPVCRDLWAAHKGDVLVSRVDGAMPDRVPDTVKATALVVLDFYGRLFNRELVDLTHNEWPWLSARGPIPDDENSSAEITRDSMRDYFVNLRQPYKGFTEAYERGARALMAMTTDEARSHYQGEWFDGSGLENWLATGEGNPWASSGGSAD